MTDPLVSSLLAAVAANPDDVPLRLHVAGVLLDRGWPAEAAELCSTVLRQQRANAEALTLLARATEALSGSAAPASAAEPAGQPAATADPATAAPAADPARSATAADATAVDATAVDATAADATAADGGAAAGGAGSVGFDWSAAEEQVSDIVPPPLVEAGPGEPVPAGEFEPGAVRLSDVGGLEAVKRRLEVAFLGPMRNPELARLYGKSLAGGLLLYGPPGCGKTFIARAVAGELGARFYAVSLADILDHYLGDTERNVKAIFDTARRNAPCVLFLDEVDAIGHRRSRIGSGWSGMRGAVNQLLHEMDSVANPATGRPAGVFVLAATNHPWDVDPALRRPGRLDRTILVLPPDSPAREAILRFHLRQRPLAGIDLAAIVRRTDDFSGADLAHLCDTAAELALESSVQSGHARPIDMSDVEAALRQVRPSTGPWLQTARNVAMFANSGAEYDDLLAYLKAKKLV
jgi:AAA+ superfamily predicted ATPase